MFWLSTSILSSSVFSSESSKTSHQLPRCVASCGDAAFHSPASEETAALSL
jgi:hypothetical protein